METEDIFAVEFDETVDARSLEDKLSDSLVAALTEETLGKLNKKMKDAVAELTDEFEYNLKDSLSYNLSRAVTRQAEEFVKSLLAGDEVQMRRYLGCSDWGYNGRDKDHHVIRGKLFETGCIDLRKKIVSDFAELLKNERILDLEDQLASVVKQFAALEARLENIYNQR